MSNIKMLPNNIINRIAAGEVIERPASIVKELIENSIDAYADNITLSIKKGGIEEVAIKDNGIGMTQEELKMAFVRHATSKIFTADDLFQIKSLGFRGEALPSIASVSEVIAKSKTNEGNKGHQLIFDNGNLTEESIIAFQTGTEIVVKNIFDKIPARKKFIGTPRGESQRITDIFQDLALSHPHISFSYYRDDNLIVKTLGDGITKNTVAMVLGNDYSKNSIPVAYQEGNYKVTGLISKPTFNQASRKKQFFFVNNRAIEDGTITHALEYNYGNLIPNGRFPFALLFIQTPFEDIDVNVHPSKKEIRFSDKNYIHSLIGRSIKTALLNQNTITGIEFKEKRREENKKINEEISGASQREISFNSLIPAAYESRETNGYSQIRETIYDSPHQTNETLSLNKGLNDTEISPVFEHISILGQVHNSFIVFQNKKGLALIDQHAAHERVIFDKLISRQDDWRQQKFAVPVKISFTNLVANNIRDYLGELNEFGFEIEPFGTNSFIMRSIPNFLINRLNHNELKEILLEAFNDKNLIKDWYENLVMDISCKAAITIRQSLNKEEILNLMRELSIANNWQYCPHGRPTVIEISFSDLEKMFKRT